MNHATRNPQTAGCHKHPITQHHRIAKSAKSANIANTANQQPEAHKPGHQHEPPISTCLFEWRGREGGPDIGGRERAWKCISGLRNRTRHTHGHASGFTAPRACVKLVANNTTAAAARNLSCAVDFRRECMMTGGKQASTIAHLPTLASIPVCV